MGLEYVEIVMEVEDEFGIAFPFDDAFGGLSEPITYGVFVDALIGAVREQNPEVSEPELVVGQFVRNLLITEYSVAPEHIVPDEKLFGPNLNLG